LDRSVISRYSSQVSVRQAGGDRGRSSPTMIVNNVVGLAKAGKLFGVPTVSELSARDLRGVVWHWWQGDDAATKRAVDIGCYFSATADTNRAATSRLVANRNLHVLRAIRTRRGVNHKRCLVGHHVNS
jgi:hypothetical protein